MPQGDFHGARNQGMPPRSRDSPSIAISILDRGRKLFPVPYSHQVQTPMEIGRSSGRSIIRHTDTGTPMGYSFPFEATVTYVKDQWCQPACMCLTQAVSSGDLGRVNAAVKGVSPFTRKHNINQQDESGRTAAMVAAWRGERAILKWLISKGCDMNAVDFDGRGVLHWAVSVESAAPGIVEEVATSNVDPLIRDRHGDTAMHRAVYRNFHEAARVMAFSYPRLVLEADKKGRLPVDLIPLGKGRKLLRQAVDLEAAMAIVKQRQEAFVMEVTEEEEKRKQEKTAASLRAADVAAKRRREALVNKSAGLGGSFLKVQQLDEVPDEFAMLDAESQEDDKEEEDVSFFTNMMTSPKGKSSIKYRAGADVHHLGAEGDEGFSRAPSGGERGTRRSSVSVMTAGPGKHGRRRDGMNLSASNGPLIPVDVLRGMADAGSFQGSLQRDLHDLLGALPSG